MLTSGSGSCGARLPRAPVAGTRSRQPPLDLARCPASARTRRGSFRKACRHLPDTPGRARRSALISPAMPNWSGAYTTADPLRVTISSLDSRNQGAAALEVLFHEGSHGYCTSPFKPPSFASAASATKPSHATSGRLWFFTPRAKSSGPVLGASGATAGDQEGSISGGGYTPYALREGLYQRRVERLLQAVAEILATIPGRQRPPSTTPSLAWSLRSSVCHSLQGVLARKSLRSTHFSRELSYSGKA